MLTQLCLFACVLASGQPPDRTSWVLAPQLARGQELVYSGSYVEEHLIPNVASQRTYRLEANVFVLENLPRRWQVAFQTSLSLKQNQQQDPKAKAAPASIRLEVAEVDTQGRLWPRSGVSLAVPLDGPPTLECGITVEIPVGRVVVNQFWEVAEDGRPAWTWQVVGTEPVRGMTCVKLLGQQQSLDWDRPRFDSTAWRRRDTVWLSPQVGIACRVERIIEHRDPGRTSPTQRATLHYELDSGLTYPAKMFEDRKLEILLAGRLAEEAQPLLRQPIQYQAQIDALFRKIAFHLDNQTPTPYRRAILQVQHRLEAAQRGEVLPNPAAEDPAPPGPLARGQRAPDFVVTDLISKQTVRLYRMLGRPVLIVFYCPGTETGQHVLRFAQTLTEQRKQDVMVLAMAVTDNVALVRQQYADLGLSFPILDGRGLHATFGVDATPRMVLLDAEGILRNTWTGWCPLTFREINHDLEECLPRRERE